MLYSLIEEMMVRREQVRFKKGKKEEESYQSQARAPWRGASAWRCNLVWDLLMRPTLESERRRLN